MVAVAGGSNCCCRHPASTHIVYPYIYCRKIHVIVVELVVATDSCMDQFVVWDGDSMILRTSRTGN